MGPPCKHATTNRGESTKQTYPNTKTNSTKTTLQLFCVGFFADLFVGLLLIKNTKVMNTNKSNMSKMKMMISKECIGGSKKEVK